MIHKALTSLALLLCLAPLIHAQARKPAHDYEAIVTRYADAMIEHGRDKYGKPSPLFASALDRDFMKIGKFGKIDGIREHDRATMGSNPYHHPELYEILYTLTERTKSKKYAKAADDALAFFFANCQSPKTGLMAWGEHIFWDFNKEGLGGNGIHEIQGPWPYWEQSYKLNAKASRGFAMGLWMHQVADQKTGNFSRHASWAKHKPGKDAEFPRYAGQMIEIWADAYGRKENRSWQGRQAMLQAIDTITNRMIANMDSPKGLLLAGSDKNHKRISWPGSNLELIRCLWVAADQIPPKLKKKMTSLALKLDENFLKTPHTLSKADGGFAATIDIQSGQPRTRSTNKPYTQTWASGYGFGTHAGMALKCLSRYEQIKKSHARIAKQYLKLIQLAADKYLDTLPNTSDLLFPSTFAEVIDLQLGMYAITKDQKYLKRAQVIADASIPLFFDEKSPLPKASNKHDHYEAITGATSLLMSLLNLDAALKAG